MKHTEKVEPVFCLFHQKKDCICIAPVTDNKTLKMRFFHAIKNNELNNKFESDLSESARRDSENENWQARLRQLPE